MEASGRMLGGSRFAPHSTSDRSRRSALRDIAARPRLAGRSFIECAANVLHDTGRPRARNRMGSRQDRLPSVSIFSLLLLTTSVAAQPAGESLAGKSVAMIIGFGPGGGYDLWGRTVGRPSALPLPGAPPVVPQTMPGAGSYAAASYIFNIAPKDGTVLGIIARDAALGPLSGATGARFDPQRLSWIGTPTKETNV